ncbi:MAG: hypothetical protein GOMPHAMPRED_002868 [Gomphillus americanus]|uniref:NadR/Ttd14 AAA domain-containing protein n=1 Tax=Gomphillus americanus TaxID=1940652 RepID=A0A8H3I8S6_9LECA|nr:MAG: hypothetical protein GOMPHAMPRED_002868 [Gomphillus americanus]
MSDHAKDSGDNGKGAKALECVYIIGAQCTGKTTLVNALENYFEDGSWSGRATKPYIVHEVARQVLSSCKLDGTYILNSADQTIHIQTKILEAQCLAESKLDGVWYIADRSALDAVVYAARYAGTAASRKLTDSDAWKTLYPRLETGLIILCPPVLKWLTEDGLRLIPHDVDDWMSIHSLFIRTLKDVNLKFETIPQDLEDIGGRVSFVLERL